MTRKDLESNEQGLIDKSLLAEDCKKSDYCCKTNGHNGECNLYGVGR